MDLFTILRRFHPAKAERMYERSNMEGKTTTGSEVVREAITYQPLGHYGTIFVDNVQTYTMHF